MAGLRYRTSPRWNTVVLLALLLSMLTAASVAGQNGGDAACGTGSPAFPVPQIRNGALLWPPSGFQPATPGQRLPPERDSTEFVGAGFQLPGADSGLELFAGIDIAGNHAYVSYNSGFMIWEIGGAFAPSPNRIATSIRDGWRRLANNPKDFCHFENSSIGVEVERVIFDIAYTNDSGTEMIALAGQSAEVGLTIWDVTNKATPVQLYQDINRPGRRAKAVRFNNTSYAFSGNSGLGPGGLHVYNMSAAKTCAPAPPACGSTCPGIYLGEIGNNLSEVGFLTVLNRTISTQERLFVAVSDGFKSALPVEVYEVDMRFGGLSSTRLFRGLQVNSQGVELFEVGTRAYLGVKEPSEIKIFDVTDCLASGNCSTLTNDAPKWRQTVGFNGSGEELLTFSAVDSNNLFLHYGNNTPCLRGTRKEGLYNVSGLGAANPVVPEVTEGGETYTDPTHFGQVDYWGAYYDSNVDGMNGTAPRMARAHRVGSTIYVYRVASQIFDVHQFGGASPPPDEPGSTVSGPGTGWLGDTIAFTVTPQNCEGSANWQWWQRENNVKTNLAQVDISHSERWNVGPTRILDVGATRLSCDSGETMSDDNVVTKSITLSDPRPVIPGITPNGGTFPIGRQITFQPSSQVSGKSPTFQWEMFDQNNNPVDLSETNTTGSTLNVDTCALNVTPVTDIFADGFESEDPLSWADIVPPWDPQYLTTGTAKAATDRPPVKGATPGNDAFTVRLTATSTVELGSFNDTESVLIEISPSGTPAFNNPPITSVDQGAGTNLLTTSTNGFETETRWEIEDDNGTASCNFGAGNVNCVVHDWGEEGSSLTHQWTTPNTAGLHAVRANIRSVSCGSGGFTEAGAQQVNVNVTNITTPNPPVVLTFDVNVGGAAACTCEGFGAPCVCSRNQPVSFTVTTDIPVNSLRFNWDDGTAIQTLPQSGNNIYTHSFSAPNVYQPTVTATAGGLDSQPRSTDVDIQ